MQKKVQFIGIIPARYASTRFPGKPLADIGGKPMIQRVYEQAKKALDTVVVATDDQRIYDCVKGFGGEVVMTRADHKCGTDRCLEAWEIVERLRLLEVRPAAPVREELTIIINIQGDEPFIQPEQIEALMGEWTNVVMANGRMGERTKGPEIATLVKPFTEADSLEDLENPNTPKVAVAADGTALMFSRSVIPYQRGVDKAEWLKRGHFYKHIGMYAYRADILKEITQLEQTPLEKAESLEQLRWLENGYKIKVAVCETASIGIDTPADLERARAFLANS